MTGLEKALIVISKTLSENRISYMVIGGMANAVWDNPRVRPISSEQTRQKDQTN